MKILILVNHEVAIYNQRLELVEALLDRGNEVYISSPYGAKVQQLIEKGCIHIPLVHNDRHGKNLFKDLVLFRYYINIMKSNDFDWVFTFNTKPNIYGAMAANITNTKNIVNITGLGDALENKTIIQKLLIFLYKISLKKTNYIFFQNKSNLNFFKKYDIITNQNTLVLPGSGVNTDYFSLLSYPDDEIVDFAFVSRIMKSKGIELYLNVARRMKQKYSNCRFHVAGFCDEPYEKLLNKYEEKGYIKYHGMVNNIKDFMVSINCLVHPTYYPEGMANIILESSSMGRPVITTDRPGCKEAIDDNITGLLIKEKDEEELFLAVEKIYLMSNLERKHMGLKARSKMIDEFQRSKVIAAYMNTIY